MIKPDVDGLIGSIKQFVSRAESAAPHLIARERAMNNSPALHSRLEDMNTKPLIRLVKKEKRKKHKIHAKVESASSPNRWSTTVETWVREFQQHRRGESLPPFDSLFK